MNKDELIEKIKQQAFDAGACSKLTGNEDWEELVRLAMSPVGMEFLIKNRFPAGQTWREIKWVADMTQYGIYIDAGEVELTDPKEVLLVGRTTAHITCTGKGRRNVNALRGASVVLTAYDWTVCRVIADATCHILKQTHGNAIIV